MVRPSSPSTTSPSKCSLARPLHSASVPGCTAGTCGSARGFALARAAVPRGLDDGRVVVEDVLEARIRHRAHDVLAQHGLHVHVGAAAQLIEARARNAVAAEDRSTCHRTRTEPDGRLDRTVVGGADGTRTVADSNASPGRPR